MYGSTTYDMASVSMKTHRIWTDLHLGRPNPVLKVLGVVHNPSYGSENTFDLTSMTSMGHDVGHGGQVECLFTFTTWAVHHHKPI